MGPTRVEGQLCDDFGALFLSEFVIHRPVEVVGNLRDLTGSYQRAQ